MEEESEEPRVKWILTEIPIRSLKENPKNPRQIGKAQFDKLGGFINKWGLIDKPVVNEDLTIIGGHQRIKLLKKKKKKIVACWLADRQLSDEDIDELCIGLNLHQGNFDYDILANEYEILDLFKYGFTEEQLVGRFEDEEVIEEKEKKGSRKKNKSCPNCGHEF